MNHNKHRQRQTFKVNMIALSIKQIIGIIAVSVLIIGIGVGVYLVQRQQILKSRAAAPAGNFVNAFELTDAKGSPIPCNDSTDPPTCTTPTLDINVRVKDLNPLLP